MNVDQFRKYIVRLPLQAVKLWSEDAEELLMLTAATESHLGEFVKQVNGPALGPYQEEAATFDDDNIWLKSHPIANFTQEIDPLRLVYEWDLATVYARIHYLRRPEPLPRHDDVIAMAEYHKIFYNSILGRATVEKTVADYNRYVARR